MTRNLVALALLFAPLAHGAPRTTDPAQSRSLARREAAAIRDARTRAAQDADREKRAASKLAEKELETASKGMPALPTPEPKTPPSKVESEAKAIATERTATKPDEAAARLARKEAEAVRSDTPAAPAKTVEPDTVASTKRVAKEAKAFAKARPPRMGAVETTPPAEATLALAELDTAKRERTRDTKSRAKSAGRAREVEQERTQDAHKARVEAQLRLKAELDALAAERDRPAKPVEAPVAKAETRLAKSDLSSLQKETASLKRNMERSVERSTRYVGREAKAEARIRARKAKRREDYLADQRERAELHAFQATEGYIEQIADDRDTIIEQVLRLADEMETAADKKEKEEKEKK